MKVSAILRAWDGARNKVICIISSILMGAVFQSDAGGESGWVVGEGPQHDIEMLDVVIEVMAEAS